MHIPGSSRSWDNHSKATYKARSLPHVELHLLLFTGCFFIMTQYSSYFTSTYLTYSTLTPTPETLM